MAATGLEYWGSVMAVDIADFGGRCLWSGSRVVCFGGWCLWSGSRVVYFGERCLWSDSRVVSYARTSAGLLCWDWGLNSRAYLRIGKT